MKKVILILMFAVLLVGVVSAQDGLVVDTSSYSWWNDLIHDLGLFTAAGQARGCSVQADDIVNPASGFYENVYFLAPCQGPSALINFYTSNWGFIDEYQLESIGNGITVNGVGILETYCCPYRPCSSNSDCEDPHGDTCNFGYGSCYYSEPTHSTPVYECENGNWNFVRNSNFGEEAWCSSASQSNYLNSPTTGSCLSSEPACSGGFHINQEGESCDGPAHLQSGQPCASGLDCQNFQCVATGSCSSGETKCEGEIYYECSSGTWDSQGREDGKCGYEGCKVTGGICFLDSDCCEPLVCGGGLLGAGQTCRQVETGNAPSKAQTWTWTEYYSKSDIDVIEDGVECLSTTDCSLKEDYDVSCIKNKNTQERIHDGQKSWCKDQADTWVWGGGLLGGLTGGIINILIDPCETYSSFEDFFNQAFSGGEKPGICVAESKTWYGGLWETALKTVGGMGLPEQFVVIITVMLLITLIGMGSRMLIK